MKQEWLPAGQKARLLEWKVKIDLAHYASRGAPELKLDEIRFYQPKKPSGWDEVVQRSMAFNDDCHAAKLTRALIQGQELCSSNSSVLQPDDWLQIGHMAIDSLDIGQPYWIRGAGFEEAWEEVPPRGSL